MRIPKGLVRCEVCGEYRGRVSGRDLYWNTRGLDPNDELDRIEFEMRLDLALDDYTVTCLCDGIPCPRCLVNKIHRPISNSYDPATNEIGHWSYLTAAMPCPECRAKEKWGTG